MIQSKTAVFQGVKTKTLASIGAMLTLSTGAFAQNQIVPGRSVGQIRLGQTSDSVQQKLGEPDKADGATGHFWNTWFSKSAKGGPTNQLDVYSVRTAKDVQAHVYQIRVTSPWFSTSNGVSPRSSSASIRRQFPHIRARGHYEKSKVGRVDVYDDEAQGIAFEIARRARQCVGIIVHRSGQHFDAILQPSYKYIPLGT